jgi:hypothetical protein
MFERLVMGRGADTVTRRGTDVTYSLMPFSVGDLAEALVFYDRVYLLGSASELANLARSVGGETFYRLCAAGYLRVRFSSTNLAYGKRDDRDTVFEIRDELGLDYELGDPSDFHRANVRRLEKNLTLLEVDRHAANNILRFVGDDDGPGKMMRNATIAVRPLRA